MVCTCTSNIGKGRVKIYFFRQQRYYCRFIGPVDKRKEIGETRQEMGDAGDRSQKTGDSGIYYLLLLYFIW